MKSCMHCGRQGNFSLFGLPSFGLALYLGPSSCLGSSSFLFCQAQFKFSASSVQFELRLSLKPGYNHPYPHPHPGKQRYSTEICYGSFIQPNQVIQLTSQPPASLPQILWLAIIWLFWPYLSHLKSNYNGVKIKGSLLREYNLNSYQTSHQLAMI